MTEIFGIERGGGMGDCGYKLVVHMKVLGKKDAVAVSGG